MAAAKSTIICFILAFFILGGISVFIAWLADKMKSPTFTIDQSSVTGYNFSASSNRLNASFSIIVRSHNRDPKYRIDYGVVVVSVYHSGYTLAYDTLGPFTQHHGQDVVFTARPTARSVLITNSGLAKDIRNETGSGHLGLEVRVRASVRFEVKRWKHKSFTLRIVCTPLLVPLSSGKSSQGTDCNVDRF